MFHLIQIKRNRVESINRSTNNLPLNLYMAFSDACAVVRGLSIGFI